MPILQVQPEPFSCFIAVKLHRSFLVMVSAVPIVAWVNHFYYSCHSWSAQWSSLQWLSKQDQYFWKGTIKVDSDSLKAEFSLLRFEILKQRNLRRFAFFKVQKTKQLLLEWKATRQFILQQSFWYFFRTFSFSLIPMDYPWPGPMRTMAKIQIDYL